MSDRLAHDRMTNSVRLHDEDGRLFVQATPISKAAVNGYYGREIPDAERFGLDSNRLYQLLRCPEELAKAAPTFNGLPVLDEHVHVTAAAPGQEHVVGSTHTGAAFDGDYLQNGMTVWDGRAIDAIKAGTRRELSSCYRYRADMTPGTYNGTAYDGVMRDIRGNHVALVETGRAGPDVLVADAAPKKGTTMKLSAKSQDDLVAALAPVLAKDAKPDEVKRLLAAARLAADADKDDDKSAKDDDEDESEEDKKKRETREKAEETAEKAKEAEEEDEDDKKSAKDSAFVFRGKGGPGAYAPPGAITKSAMDSAIQKARADAVADMRALQAAERDVQPLVGEVLGMDSAEAVYRYALNQRGVDNKTIHASALPSLVAMQKQLVASGPARTSKVAMDSAARNDFAARFPTASNPRRMG